MKHPTKNKNRILLKIVSNIFIWLSVATDTTYLMRAGAALATSVSIDHGTIEPNDTKFVIDRSKLQRERMRHRDEMRKEEKELFGKVDGIYVDGKKDGTLVFKELDGKYSRRSKLKNTLSWLGNQENFI